MCELKAYRYILMNFKTCNDQIEKKVDRSNVLRCLDHEQIYSKLPSELKFRV